jgi:hypothetical protein
MSELSLFVGPSGHGLDLTALAGPQARLLPPARRGDVARLIERTPPGVAIICDGVFQVEPAVSHAELCAALDAGWQVWGVSSIGAIRAYELRAEGMRGFGYVHAQFERIADFADDEVCLLHFPEPPYFPVSEALVNVRFALDRKRDELRISRRSESALIAALRGLWFGDRTEETLRALMREHGKIRAESAEALLAWIKLNRVKTIDLADLLVRRPWLG